MFLSWYISLKTAQIRYELSSRLEILYSSRRCTLLRRKFLSDSLTSPLPVVVDTALRLSLHGFIYAPNHIGLINLLQVVDGSDTL